MIQTANGNVYQSSCLTVTDLQPLNTQEAEHVGHVEQVVSFQLGCIQLLTKMTKEKRLTKLYVLKDCVRTLL